MQCVVCQDDSTYLKLLECCQLKSESKSMLCHRCVIKVDKCPLCRSAKRLTNAMINSVASDYELICWLRNNVLYARYKYKATQYLLDRITPLEFAIWLKNLDVDNIIDYAQDYA